MREVIFDPVKELSPSDFIEKITSQKDSLTEKNEKCLTLFMYLIKSNSIDKIEKLIEEVALDMEWQLSQKDNSPNHWTAWDYAMKLAINENEPRLLKMLTKYVQYAHTGTVSGLLCIYAKLNEKEFFVDCLRYGNPNTPSFYGYPLHWVCECGNTEMFDALISWRKDEEFIDINVRDSFGSTGIIIALENKRVEIAEKLMSHPDINLHLSSFISGSALTAAIYTKQFDFAKKLLSNKKLETIVNKDHPGALAWAIINNQKDIILALLKQGLNPVESVSDYLTFDLPKLSDLDHTQYALVDNDTYDWGANPLLLAMMYQDITIIEALLEYGSIVEKALSFSEGVFGSIKKLYEIRDDTLMNLLKTYHNLQKNSYIIVDQLDLLFDEFSKQTQVVKKLMRFFIENVNVSDEEAFLFSEKIFPPEYAIPKKLFFLVYCAVNEKKLASNSTEIKKILIDNTVKIALGEVSEFGINFYLKMIKDYIIKNISGFPIPTEEIELLCVKKLGEAKKELAMAKKTSLKNIIEVREQDSVFLEPLKSYSSEYNDDIEEKSFKDPIKTSLDDEKKHSRNAYKNTMSFTDVFLLHEKLSEKLIDFLEKNRKYLIKSESKKQKILDSIKVILYHEENNCSWSRIPQDVFGSTSLGTVNYYYRTFLRNHELQKIKDLVFEIGNSDYTAATTATQIRKKTEWEPSIFSVNKPYTSAKNTPKLE